MRRKNVMRSALALLLAAATVAAGMAAAQSPEGTEPEAVLANLGTAFTYQGRLVDAGAPAAGVYDLQFRLYDAAAGGVQIGATQPVNDVAVAGGLFTATLDFGAGAFNGLARWLEIDVKRNADAGYTTLSPRVALSPAPHALALPGLWTQQNATSPNLIGGYAGNVISAGVTGGIVAGGGSSGSPNRVYDRYGSIGGGLGNTVGTDDGDTTNGSYATVAGGFHNNATRGADTVGGGQDNDAIGGAATVGGGRFNTASGLFATVGGGRDNQASNSYATVGGGWSNEASNQHSTVGGGYQNTVNGESATVSGGNDNVANNQHSTVGGGYFNRASGEDAIVGGGANNTASGSRSTVGGGSENEASNQFSTVGGGGNNSASGAYATVFGGYGAVASHFGEAASASGSFFEIGDAQTSLYVLRRETMVSGWNELFLDGTAERITLAADRAMTFDILIIGATSSGTSYSIGYQITGVIKNTGGGDQSCRHAYSNQPGLRSRWLQ